MMSKELVNYLKEFVTEKRYNLFNKVLDNRTRYFSVALEDIYQSQNASAVLRSADCFGIQDIHIIENRNKYNINPDVAVGSPKWLNLYKYDEKENNTLDAINHLKKQGYRVVATTPHTNDVSLHDFDITKGKFVMLFGTELEGVTQTVLDNVYEFLRIPMYGFTESFNISVSAALVMQHLSDKIRNSNVDWHLTQEERDELMLDWILKTIKRPDELIKRFNSERTK